MKLFSARFQIALVCAVTSLVAFTSHAQRQMEKLGRGVVAVRTGTSSAYVGWRLLGTDADSTGFNLYRITSGATNKLNVVLLTNTTDYVDSSVNYAVANSYFVEPVVSGVTQAVSAAYTLIASAPTQQFLNIPLTPPAGGTAFDGVPYTYTANDCSAGDVDGDGEYEIILKWDPSNSQDNSIDGFTGNTHLDCYKLNGTRLWRIDLGPNIRSGAHYMDFMVYDFDGDGKAELMCRTAPGSLDGAGNYVGSIAKWQNANGARPTFNDTDDYRFNNPNGTANGYVLAGPEFITVFNGLTGEDMATSTWYPKRDPDNNNDNPTAARINTVWGDGYGNRLDRFLAGIAFLDGRRPSGIFCRGYYTRAYVTAWDWRTNTLTRRWSFNSDPSNLTYKGQGAHSLSIGDADGDGKDEIVYGAACIDDNGQGLYSTGLGHGDALHFSDMDPWHPGLEVWMVHEDPGSYGPNGSEYRDAKTGALIFGVDGQGDDVGRGVAYDIDPRFRGYEMWGSRGGLMSATGVQITSSRPSQMNFCVWWDADMLRETLDDTTIYKWSWTSSANNSILSPAGIDSNNSTKATPNLSADILGDWREEVVWRTLDNLNLRIYTTTTPATNRIYTLMHDPQYRCAIAWQNTGYNQPPHPGYFIGQDMFTPPLPPMSNARLLWRGGGGNVWDAGSTANWFTNGVWSGANPATVFNDGDSVLFDLSGSNSAPVVINSSLAPGAVTVYAVSNYTFAGAGELTGVMSLTKAGVGTLTLANTNSFTGATAVSDGALRVNGSLNASPVSARWPGVVGGSGRLGKGLTLRRGGGVEPGGAANLPGTLTISNSLVELGETVNRFDLSNDPTGVTKTNDRVQVVGSIGLSGTNSVEVKLLNGSLGNGTYDLISYSGSLTGSVANLSVSGLPGEVYFLTNPPGLISLVYPAHRAATNLLWVGGGANNWDLATTVNWTDGVSAQKFYPDDTVRFDSTGLNSPAINVVGILRPGAIVVDATNNYTLGGSGSFVGTGGLTKTNSGTLALNTTGNAYTGRTILGGGVVSLTALGNGGLPSPIGAAGKASSNLVFYGGTLRYAGSTTGTDRGATFNTGGATIEVSNSATTLTINGTLTGSGSLTKLGGGDLSIGAANTFSGGTTIRAGTISLGAAVANTSGLGTGSLTLTNGALLDMFASGSGDTAAGSPFATPIIVPTNGVGTIYMPFRISMTGTLTGGGTLNIRANGSRNEWFGSAANFTGQINVTSRTGISDLRCNNSAGYPNARINLANGTTLQYRLSGTPNVSIGELSGASGSAITATGGSNGLGVNWNVGGLNTSFTFSGSVQNNVGIVKVGTGTMTLGGTNSHTGPTTVSAGTLLVTGNGSAASSAVTVAVAGTLGGTGIIGGTTTVNGKLSPGSNAIGTLTFSGNLTLNATSTAFIEINKNAGTKDLADAGGTLTYGGTLQVTNLAGTLANGNSYKIFDAAAYAGSFNSYNLPLLPNGLAWDTSALVTSGTISVTTAAPTGPQALTWKGDGLGNVWDAALTPNWLNASNATSYFNQADAVTFDDTGSNNTPVILATVVQPAALTVNAAKDYIFAGAGVITGTNSLFKSGPGTLTLTTPATYSGATTIADGTVKVLGLGAGLAHRWSFNNSLADSVGAQAATIVEVGANNATLGSNSVTLAGGTRTTSDYVSLGAEVLSNSITPVTVELWATQNAIQNWGRIFDFGSGTTESLMMSWTVGTALASDRVEWVRPGVTNTVNNSNQPYTTNVEFHIAMVIEPGAGAGGTTRVTWYRAPSSTGTLGAARGTFDSANALLSFTDTNCWLGRSQWTGDNTASASYNEVRIWNRTLGAADLQTLHSAGPDAALNASLPAATVVNLTGASARLENLSGLPLTIGSLAGVAGSEARMTSGGLAVGGNDASTTFGGFLSGTNDLTKSGEGTLSLSGANTYSGATTISAGTLLIGGAGQLGSGTYAASITNNGTFIYNGSLAQTLSGAHSGLGALIQNGPGTLTLSGANTYSGDTTVNGGTLVVNSSIPGALTVNPGGTLGGSGTLDGAVTLAAGSTFAPGASIGTLTVSNNLTLGGNLAVEVDTSASPLSDLCIVSGTLTNAGTGWLTVANLGPTLALGDSFTLFNQPLPNGGTLTITPAPGPGLAWTNKLAIDGTIAVVANGPASYTERIYAVTTDNQLISFQSATPGTVLSSVLISGLQGADQILGVDFVGDTLYAVGNSSRLYTLNRATGEATLVGQFTPVISGSWAGVEAEPAGVRVLTDLDQQLVLNLGNGAATAGATLVGSPNPTISGLAYHPGTGVRYVADYVQNTIGTLDPATGLVTPIGATTIDFSRNNGFDISGKAASTAYLATPASSSGSAANLYTVDLGTGTTSLVGLIGNAGDNILIRGLAVGPEFSAVPTVNLNPTNITFSVSGGNLTLSWPASHVGWTLQCQTNSRSVGLSTVWVPYNGGYANTNNVVIPIGPANDTMFFRLIYP